MVDLSQKQLRLEEGRRGSRQQSVLGLLSVRCYGTVKRKGWQVGGSTGLELRCDGTL